MLAELYRHEGINPHDLNSRHFLRKIREGEWTLMLLYEEQEESNPTVRYAFITATPPEKDKKGMFTDALASCEGSPSTVSQELRRTILDVMIVGIRTYIESVIPGVTEQAAERKLVLRNRRSIGDVKLLLDEESDETKGLYGKICSRDEVESGLRSSDFDDAVQEK
jgi:hypothetical protein